MINQNAVCDYQRRHTLFSQRGATRPAGRLDEHFRAPAALTEREMHGKTTVAINLGHTPLAEGDYVIELTATTGTERDRQARRETGWAWWRQRCGKTVPAPDDDRDPAPEGATTTYANANIFSP